MTKTDVKTKTDDGKAASGSTEPPKTKQTDYLAQIGGALTIEKAREIFGKANAPKAFRAMAAAGGYGIFKDTEMENLPLAMPEDEEMRAKINEALNNLDS